MFLRTKMKLKLALFLLMNIVMKTFSVNFNINDTSGNNYKMKQHMINPNLFVAENEVKHSTVGNNVKSSEDYATNLRLNDNGNEEISSNLITVTDHMVIFNSSLAKSISVTEPFFTEKSIKSDIDNVTIEQVEFDNDDIYKTTVQSDMSNNASSTSTQIMSGMTLITLAKNNEYDKTSVTGNALQRDTVHTESDAVESGLSNSSNALDILSVHPHNKTVDNNVFAENEVFTATTISSQNPGVTIGEFLSIWEARSDGRYCLGTRKPMGQYSDMKEYIMLVNSFHCLNTARSLEKAVECVESPNTY